MVNKIADHMDIWTSAEIKKANGGRGRGKNSNGQSPHGINKLRELILELAVRGKLVPQDPYDEPASVLLEKIAKERIRLVNEKKIKKPKALPEITDEEKPFDLPDGWEWARLGDFIEFVNGFAFKSSDFSDTGVGVVKIGDIQNGEITTDSMSRVDEAVVAVLDDSLRVNKGEMLIAMSGATTGKLGFNTTNEVFYINQRVGKILPYCFYVKYLYYPLTTKIAENLAKSMGSAIPNLSTAQIKNIVLALPPLTEQHRIVAKVDELMALCDQLEQQQTNSNDTHQTLVETLLATLTSAVDQKRFPKAWQRIANHFDTLFATEQSIDQLKQTVLQLAVMGKLVPQDPNDEPASVLLEKIAKEKARLIKEGKIKKQKPLPEISEDETPFDLPAGWSFVRLVELSKLITKGSSPKWQGVAYTEDPEDVLFVTSENVGSYVLKLDSRKYVEKKFNEVEPRSILGKGDYLMNIVGASIGRTAIYDIDDLANINQAVCLIRVFSQFLDSQYLLHFFNSEICVSYMFDKQVDNARANLSMGNIAKFVIPFPPLTEQQRIVAKVDELMALCDTLKERLNDAQTTQVQLADSMVERAVA